ncbi:inorganic pyrophosphatase, partial [Gordonia sihwensis]|uniref:inorganic diphosphatase n=1 Tax=Gordonia sihwensis TaxID=173559 RepID=UPI001C9316A6
QDIDDVSEFELNAISHFYEHYKDHEPGKEVTPGGWVGKAEAAKVAQAAVDRYQG